MEIGIEDVLPLWEELARQGKSFAFRVWGASMLPTIRAGSLVEVEPCGAADLRVGDVAVVKVGRDKVLVHRVVAVSGATIRTRGDAVANADSPTQAEGILGRVVAIGAGPSRSTIAPRLWRLGGARLVRMLALFRLFRIVARPIARVVRDAYPQAPRPVPKAGSTTRNVRR